ncbi:RNA polymerase sigma factor [uncultured Ruthenibacterium sp.]|uniref:RNA polymerase sigma factor n=1 Tax=uncultured Ruthenibacterium sp. TaxID=1905347 RepID=UPI00349ED354
MRSEQELNAALDKYADMVRRLCVLHLKSTADTEDVFQTVFMKYMMHTSDFESEEHEKAWLIRVTMNACKDLLRSFFHSRTVSLDTLTDQIYGPSLENQDVLEAVFALPEKYRRVVYLHYYEGYTAPQIGSILGKNVNTVYTLLTRSRKLLRHTLGEKADEE